MKDEINVSTNVRSRIWYDENGREIKEEKSKNDKIILIVEREFDKKGNVIADKEIVGLTIKQRIYHYKDSLYKTETYENGKIKSIETNEKEGAKKLVVYGNNGLVMTTWYNQDGVETSTEYTFK